MTNVTLIDVRNYMAATELRPGDSYNDRNGFIRRANMVLPTLEVHRVALLRGLSAADAVAGAYGGHPNLAYLWRSALYVAECTGHADTITGGEVSTWDVTGRDEPSYELGSMTVTVEEFDVSAAVPGPWSLAEGSALLERPRKWHGAAAPAEWVLSALCTVAVVE